MRELFVPMTAKQRRVDLDALLLLAGLYLRDCARESRSEGELGEEHIVCAVREACAEIVAAYERDARLISTSLAVIRLEGASECLRAIDALLADQETP